MLIEFSVTNFRSFRQRGTLSMVAAKLRSRDHGLDSNNTFSVDEKLTLLRSAAIYGPNESGKSNLASAMGFMKRFVLMSAKDMQAEQPIGLEGFRLSDIPVEDPSSFEVVFRLEGKEYRYGFAANRERVIEEWLYFVPSGREVSLFRRKEDSIKVNSAPNRFSEGKGLERRTRPNALFLSVVAQFNGETARKIIRWFLDFNVIMGLADDAPLLDYTVNWIKDRERKEGILQMLHGLDINILDLKIEETRITADNMPREIPPGLRSMLLNGSRVDVKTLHRRYDKEGHPSGFEEFMLSDQESGGTQKIVALAGLLLDTLQTGKVLVVDEFDARLHPKITQTIVKLFNSDHTNPRNAQLVFMTHDTNLLDRRLLRRDQVWFMEKDSLEGTSLYSLAEFGVGTVRNDSSFKEGYIRGRFGALPFIGDLERLVGVTHD